MAAFAFITVEKGDIVGVTSRNKPYREYTISYRLVNNAEDSIRLRQNSPVGVVKHMYSGSMSKMIEEARLLAKKFRNKSIWSQIQVIGCGNFNGKWVLADDGKFYKV